MLRTQLGRFVDGLLRGAGGTFPEAVFGNDLTTQPAALCSAVYTCMSANTGHCSVVRLAHS